MATNKGNVDRIEEQEQEENEGNREANHHEGDVGSQHGDGDVDSQHEDDNPARGNGGEPEETLDMMLAAMPDNVKKAAREWEPKEFIEALSEAVEIKKAKKLSKAAQGSSSIEDTEEPQPTNPPTTRNSRRRKSSTGSELHGCDLKERTVPVSEVLKIMREERRAERASCELQSRRSAIPPRPHTFDGLTSGEHFLEEFVFYIENSGPGTPHQTDYTNSFAAFLTDRAKIWYKRLSSSDQHNWGTLAKLFREDFVDHFREEAKEAYKHRCQGSGETVESYSNDMDRLLSNAGLSKDDMLEVYIANLKSALRRHVRKQRPANIREAERLAREKEADIKESLHYFSPAEDTPADSEDQMLNRLLERVQALTSAQTTTKQEVRKTPKELEDDLISKLLEKIQLVQSKGKPASRKPTLAALSTVKAAGGKRKGAKARKKKNTAQEEDETPQHHVEAAAPPVPSVNTPGYPPMQFPFYPGPMMPHMPQFQGQAFFPYPPPGYGHQAPMQNQVHHKSTTPQNQGN